MAPWRGERPLPLAATRAVLAVLLAVAAGVAAPAAARGASYSVLTCDAAPGGVNESWRARSHRGMLARTACPTRGSSRRGLVVRNRVNAGTVRRDRGAFMTFTAPGGATLAGIELEWHGRRATGEWTIGLRGGDGGLIAGCRGGVRSPRAGCRLRDPKGAGRSFWSLDDRRSVRIEASCAARGGCDTRRIARSADGTRARLALHYAAVEVEDHSLPDLVAADGNLLTAGWQRGERSVVVDARDNVGVRTTALDLDGARRETDQRECDFTRRVPCPRATRTTYGLDSRELADGEHALALVAVDTAGNARRLHRTIRVDNHAPAAVRDVRVAGGDRVRSTNSFDLRWTPPAGQAAPIARARYRLCREGSPHRCVEGARKRAAGGIDGLSVPGRGNWRFRAWLEDAAGNVDRRNASEPVTLRFDDRLPTRLRAEIVTGDGAARRATIGFRDQPAIRGTLADFGGAEVHGARLAVSARTRGSTHTEPAGTVYTDRAGRFSYQAPRGPSRTVRFTYGGSERHRPARASVRLAVRARSSIAVSRHRVENGDRVRFRGSLLRGPFPPEGKLVQLEAFYRGRWRTFAVVRADRRGRWRYPYRFEATRGRVTYPFRVWVPRERSYPYAVGRSGVVRVTVDGR